MCTERYMEWVLTHSFVLSLRNEELPQMCTGALYFYKGRGGDIMAGKVEQLTEEIVLKILPEEYELVDIEYVKEGSMRYLRIYIDRSGKMSLNDCETLSRIIGEKLDEADPISENYMLEISSPGLDRPLKKDRDFVREQGKEVEIRLYKPLSGMKEFEGKLIGLNENGEVEIMAADRLLRIPRKDIALIRLAVKF